VLWDLMADRLPQSKATLSSNGRVETYTVDITNEDQVMAATAAAVKALGKIDILVNSAGITGPNQKTWEYSSKDFQQVMEINLMGTFHCCKAVVPWMMKQDYGRIVNIASIAGKEGNPNAPAYSASKAAVIGLTKSLGKELAQTGVRVNALTPAAAKTEMFSQMTEQHIQFMLSKIPMNRFVQVEEIAAMIAWMASEECSFTTGSVFDISGGRAVY
jgi:3-oxoacyl-[acyl-carrier protein] reductase